MNQSAPYDIAYRGSYIKPYREDGKEFDTMMIEVSNDGLAIFGK